MNKETLNKLKELAQKAVPGPWSAGNARMQNVHEKFRPMTEVPIHVGEGTLRGNCHAIVYNGGLGATSSAEDAVTANAAFIAAANPATVLELIALAERTTSPVSERNETVAVLPNGRTAANVYEAYRIGMEQMAASVDERTTSPVSQMTAEPVAWMRKWAFDGEKPAKQRNENGRMAWPAKFKVLPITQGYCFNDDVPLYAAPAIQQPQEAAKPSEGSGDVRDSALKRAASLLDSFYENAKVRGCEKMYEHFAKGAAECRSALSQERRCSMTTTPSTASQAPAVSRAERVAEQRQRMQERFANRPKTPATADFDLPAPNDAIEPQPQADESGLPG